MATEVHPRRQIPTRAPKKAAASWLSDPKPNPKKHSPSPAKPGSTVPPARTGYGYRVPVGRNSCPFGTGAFLPDSKGAQNQRFNPGLVQIQPQVANGSGTEKVRDTSNSKAVPNTVAVQVGVPWSISRPSSGTGVFLPRIPTTASPPASPESKKTLPAAAGTTMYVEKQKKKVERRAEKKKKKQSLMEVSPELLLPAEWTY